MFYGFIFNCFGGYSIRVHRLFPVILSPGPILCIILLVLLHETWLIGGEVMLLTDGNTRNTNKVSFSEQQGKNIMHWVEVPGIREGKRTISKWTTVRTLTDVVWDIITYRASVSTLIQSSDSSIKNVFSWPGK
jgi:hypothetical protein